MTDIKEYDRIIAATEKYRTLITSTIRDLCHAYQAVDDRRDFPACVRNLVAARNALFEALTKDPPRLNAISTGIGPDSLKSTLVSIVQVAQKAMAEIEKLDEDGTPDAISAWLGDAGKRYLGVVAQLIVSLLNERNMAILVRKLFPQG